MKPIIAISMGDYNGVGPEVTLKAFPKIDLDRSIPIWIGSGDVLQQYSDLLGLELPITKFQDFKSLSAGNIYLFDLFKNQALHIHPGTLSADAGKAAMEAVEKGIQFCLNRESHALVTAPISKEAISLAGYTVPGHTEFLAEKTSSKKILMILASDVLRVGLCTIHTPLKDVAAFIRAEKVSDQINILHDSLLQDFGIINPKIAVLGLNPHAGDGGVIGREEIEVIEPVVRQFTQKGIHIDGPFAADGFFGSEMYKQYDAIFAMYHDQGLIPFKLLSFGGGVNFSAGLPIIRTSPDHGTAFTIAGKNLANENSFLKAYKLAVEMAENRYEIK